MTTSGKLPRFKFEKYVPSDKGKLSLSRWKRFVTHRISRLLLGAVAGALAGGLYWKFVGCHSGTCPITASPLRTVIVFSVMGILFAREKPVSRA